MGGVMPNNFSLCSPQQEQARKLRQASCFNEAEHCIVQLTREIDTIRRPTMLRTSAE